MPAATTRGSSRLPRSPVWPARPGCAGADSYAVAVAVRPCAGAGGWAVFAGLAGSVSCAVSLWLC